MAYVAPTAEELRSQSESLYNPAYQTELTNALNTYNTNKQSLSAAEQQQRTAAEQAIGKYGKTAGDNKKVTERTVNDSAVKRNMSRSSRVLYDLSSEMGKIDQSVLDYNATVNQQLNDALANFGSQRQNLDASYANTVATAGATYQQNVAAKQLELMQYNEGIRQFEEQLAAAAAGGGGGGGGGAAPAYSTEDLFTGGAGAGGSNYFVPTLGSGNVNTGAKASPKAPVTSSAMFGNVNPATKKSTVPKAKSAATLAAERKAEAAARAKASKKKK